ncbi:putative O-methyltransferase [Quillaja saponaria]|uniref:O-methyltransferase n=1 Tax=Quillaja saponaria TaxID=32244 RepID=A0AAD7VN33_QUISA|nr:putative O-methyltransferase [Quillaja saponaria]
MTWVVGPEGNMMELVQSYPHIKGINFDQLHVVVTTPSYYGVVTHVGGDMFQAIPSANAIFMKWILHDWNDEQCIKILKNCRKAILEKAGKLITVQSVLKEDGNGKFDDINELVLDLSIIAHTSGGKERTELEWKRILEKGGFPHYKVIKIQALPSIIEAYPM